MNWWIQLTQGQGTLLSGAITGACAISAAILAVTVFSRKVRSLESALSESQNLLTAHRESVVQTLGDIQERIAVLDTQSGSLLESSARIEGSVTEISEAQPAPDDGGDNLIDTWSELRNRWFSVRDRLEEIAADEGIDGRTRAKYGRLDRRQFGRLIDAVEADGHIMHERAALFRRALELWLSFRNNRMKPAQEHLSEMDNLLASVG
jgi:hypothetical protein